MQKPRFDLRRLRDAQIHNLRDRTARLRNIQTHGAQDSHWRQLSLRGEYVVPVAAFLLLVIALIFNAYSSRSGDVAVTPEDAADTVETNIATTPTALDAAGPYPAETSTPTLASAVYPAGTSTPGSAAYPALTTTQTTVGGPTPIAIVPPLVTGTEVLPGTSVYPAPTGDLPLPIGTPIAGGLPPAIDGSLQPPVLIPTAPSRVLPIATATLPSTTGGGYPSPAAGVNQPQPGTLSAPAVIPPRVATPPSALQPVPGITTLPTATPRVAVVPPTAAPNQRIPTTAPGLPLPPAGTALVVPTPGSEGQPGGATPVTQPTAEVIPTSTPEPTPTPVPPTPTPKPFRLIEGSVRWQAGAPIIVEQDYVIAPGAVVQIDPGAEVQVKPGADIFVEGQLIAARTPGAPVRFVGPAGRWNTLVGQPGSAITLDNVELRNAGAGGVALASSGGRLTLRNVLLTDSGGGIATAGSAVDIQGSQITGNNLANGPALLVRLGAAPATVLRGNIIGGNQAPAGTPQVRLVAGENGSAPIDVQGNAFAGGAGPLLDIQTPAPIGGTIRCNGFRAGSVGFQLSSSTASGSGFALAIDNNAFEQQAIYGAASTVSLQAGNNWWGDPSGPLDVERNPQGLGVRVGVNVGFQPSLPARPACAPMP